MKFFRKPDGAIDLQLDCQVREEVARKRRALKPIIESILFCAKLGLPLRGHRDHGSLQPPTSFANIDFSSGNLRAVLQLTTLGNEDLEDHLTRGKKNAQYIAKTAQNEIISCIGDNILNKITTDIKAAKFFAVIADETSDVSRSEQLYLCIRYFFDCRIREEFVGFCDICEFSSEPLANTIIEKLQDLGLNMEIHGGTRL